MKINLLSQENLESREPFTAKDLSFVASKIAFTATGSVVIERKFYVAP